MSDPTPTPAEVVGTFTRLTGIRFQWPPFAVQRQAHDFVVHGFFAKFEEFARKTQIPELGQSVWEWLEGK